MLLGNKTILLSYGVWRDLKSKRIYMKTLSYKINQKQKRKTVNFERVENMSNEKDEANIVIDEGTQDEIEMLKAKIEKVNLKEILRNFR